MTETPNGLDTRKSTAAARSAGRPAQESRRPYHVGVALGLAAGMYAGSLALVTRLQVDHDRALIEDRQPVVDAIELLGRHHDAMEGDLARAGGVFDEAATTYDALVAGLGDLQADVARLTRQLSRIGKLAIVDGSGLGPVTSYRSSGGSLPTVSKSVSRSGGGSSGGASSASGGGTSNPPPPTQTKTGASGKP